MDFRIGLPRCFGLTSTQCLLVDEGGLGFSKTLAFSGLVVLTLVSIAFDTETNFYVSRLGGCQFCYTTVNAAIYDGTSKHIYLWALSHLLS